MARIARAAALGQEIHHDQYEASHSAVVDGETAWCHSDACRLRVRSANADHNHTTDHHDVRTVAVALIEDRHHYEDAAIRAVTAFAQC